MLQRGSVFQVQLDVKLERFVTKNEKSCLPSLSQTDYRDTSHEAGHDIAHDLKAQVRVHAAAPVTVSTKLNITCGSEHSQLLGNIFTIFSLG